MKVAGKKRATDIYREIWTSILISKMLILLIFGWCGATETTDLRSLPPEKAGNHGPLFLGSYWQIWLFDRKDMFVANIPETAPVACNWIWKTSILLELSCRISFNYFQGLTCIHIYDPPFTLTRQKTFENYWKPAFHDLSGWHKNMQPLACGWAEEWFDTVSNCAT